MPLKAILLGSLGTLADTAELQRRALNAAFAEAGLDWDLTQEEYRERAHLANCADLVASCAEVRGTAVDAAALQRRASEVFRGFLAQVSVPTRPGLKELIAATHNAGLRLGLVTTASPDCVEAMLAVTGLEPGIFDFIGDETAVSSRKPAPDIYRKALDALSLEPAEALAIEDTAENAQSAEAAGITCVSFPGAAHVGGRLGLISQRVAKLAPEERRRVRRA